MAAFGINLLISYVVSSFMLAKADAILRYGVILLVSINNIGMGFNLYNIT